MGKIGIQQVHLRGGFSDRNGIKNEPIEMQYKNFNTRTRVALANTMHHICSEFEGSFLAEWKCALYQNILENAYSMIIEQPVYDGLQTRLLMRSTILEDEYDSVLTIIEYVVSQIYYLTGMVDYSNEFNETFKREYVGYRFVNQLIVPITDEQEIQAIEIAVNSPFTETNVHLEKALKHISNREHPDYENSIKESITAVETTCGKITGKKASLGDALKTLEKNGIAIHPSLKSGFEKIFGYASDAKGIRHAGDLGGTSSTFEEAQFMLVACSAFVNYLIGNTSK